MVTEAPREAEVSGLPLWRRVAVVLIGWPLAAFFGFVGWHKATATMAQLATYHAWTAHVPEWIGRPIGWLEMVTAIALLAAISQRIWPMARWLGMVVAATQFVSSAIHLKRGEASLIAQNVVLVAGLAAFFWLTRPTPQKEQKP